MLKATRRVGKTIMIGDDVNITVLGISSMNGAFKPTIVTDPTVRIGTAIFLVVILFYLEPIFFGETPKTYPRLYFDLPLLVMAIVSFQYRLQYIEDVSERRFWNLWSLGFSAWLTQVVLLIVTGSETIRSIEIEIAGDSLFFLFYVALALGLESQPHRSAEHIGSRLRVLNWLGVFIFFLGLLLYFVIVPQLFEPDAYKRSSWVFFVVFDLYLSIRLAGFIRTAGDRRWRRIYAWLLVVSLLWLYSDGLGLVTVLGDSTPVPFFDLFLLPCFLAALYAARSRELSWDDAGDKWSRIAPRPGSPLGPLMFYALMFPLMHFGIARTTLFDASLATTRESLVLIFLILLSILAYVYQRLLEAENRSLENDLRRSHALYSQAEHMGKMGYWERDVMTNQLITCSKEYAKIFGTTVEKEFFSLLTYDEEVNKFIHEEDHDRYIQVTEAAYESKEAWDIEYRIINLTGKMTYVRELGEPVLDEHGTLIRTFGTLQDVTGYKQTEEQLSFQASHDALTGLVNRREFERRAERLLATVNHDKREHALCYMDLDQFKVVNDTCGHAAGDELLRQLSSVLKDKVRHRDTLARLGGDEFGILMEHCSLDDAHRVAIALQKAIREYSFLWEGRRFKVGVSIGLVHITEATVNLTQLLKDADAACYIAKDKGRNHIHVYQAEDSDIARRHGEMQWVARINHALETDQFCLYAQTIEPLDGGHDKHYELLIRMVDEKGRLIPPGVFLPAAERYNLIEQLDRWVIEEAMTLLSANPRFLNQIRFVSINLSGQSLARHDFLDFIISALDKSGIEASKLCFEITETAAITNLATAGTLINTLKDIGCHFALDDFGSGLSSFAYLKHLPVDYLKIDGMFVKDIVEDPLDYAMVKSINEIGKVMGMRSIAEFVENDEVKGMLTGIGVNYAQGYGIGKPLAFDELLGRSNINTTVSNG